MTHTNIADPYLLVAARRGTMLVNRNDIYMGQAYLQYGECCELETQFLLSMLRLPGLVIEVGSNMGVHTIPMAAELMRQGRSAAGSLLALEPQPVIFQQLCANLALNGLMNVAALPYACGRETGAVTFEAPDYLRSGNFGGTSMLCHGGASAGPAQLPNRVTPRVAVQCVRLDDLVPEGDVGLIKIDVEGLELEVLLGSAGILARCRPVLYVENDRPERSQQLIQYLLDFNYRLWWHIPALFNPDNMRGVLENHYPSVCSFNMLCVPKESSIHVDASMEIFSSDCDPRIQAARVRNPQNCIKLEQ
jgi:FkbM family methyltransferase